MKYVDKTSYGKKHEYRCTEIWKYQKYENIQLFLVYIYVWNFIVSMLYFQLIFIVFPVLFSPFFTEKVPTCEFRHNSLAAQFLKNVYKEKIQEEKLEQFWSSHKSEKLLLLLYVFFYYFRDINIRVLTSIFYPNYIDYQRFQY